MNEDLKQEDRMGDPSLAKKITMPLLQAYFHHLEAKKGGDCLCPLCGSTHWYIPASPESISNPLILTLPIPAQKGLGVWVFPIYCKSCAHMLLLETSQIVSHLVENGKL